MSRVGILAGFSVTWFVLAGSGTSAEETAAGERLRNKGLRKAGLTFVLPIESELNDGVRKARMLRIRLAKAQKDVQAREEQDRKTQRAFLQRRSELNRKLTGARDVQENNQAVGQLNDLEDQMKLFQEEQQKKDKEVRDKFTQTRDEFQQALSEVRRLADEAQRQYADLAGDAEVTAALEELGQADGKTYSLGPGRTLPQNLKAIEDLEGTILSETIELQPKGGVFWLDATLNGEFTRPMVLDTGASFVTLPGDFAAEIGLKPNDDDPVITLKLADGKKVQGKRMTLRSVRVGKFTVKDVECAVMPSENTQAAPPLLGGSFLKYFTCKMEPDARKLTLSKVETTPSAKEHE